MFVGVSSATQPINGYNFGAKHYDRVRKTYKTAAGIAIIISILWFIVYQVFPGQIAGLFVSGNPLYTECAAHCFRIYMMAFFLYGLHMTTSSFFQGIGKPSRALIISLVRQAVLMIPLSLILSGKFGLDGLSRIPLWIPAILPFTVFIRTRHWQMCAPLPSCAGRHCPSWR